MKDFPFIIVSAVRYALPRHTYCVGITAEFLERHFMDSIIPPLYRSTIIKEIEEHLEYISRLEALGSQDPQDADTRRWKLCLSRLKSMRDSTTNNT